MSDDNRGGGAGDAGDVVVLGQPEAGVAPPLRMLGQVKAVPERVRRAGALSDGGEVEDGEGQQQMIRFKAEGPSYPYRCDQACSVEWVELSQSCTSLGS